MYKRQVLISISNFKNSQSNNDQFQRSLHFIEVVSKELDVKKEDVYVNTSAATDGAVSYTHLDVYKRQGLFSYIGYVLLATFITVLTLGICAPWGVCIMYNLSLIHICDTC